MPYVNIETSKLQRAPWNYKNSSTQDQVQYCALKNNMAKNGQIDVLTVRELPEGRYEIVNGNHRFDAMEELGWETATCFNLGPISEDLAKRIAVELNETRFTNDPARFSELINNLCLNFEMPDLMSTMPFTEIDFTKMLNPTQETQQTTAEPAVLKKMQIPFSNDSLRNEFKSLMGSTDARPLGDRLLDRLRG